MCMVLYRTISLWCKGVDGNSRLSRCWVGCVWWLDFAPSPGGPSGGRGRSCHAGRAMTHDSYCSSCITRNCSLSGTGDWSTGEWRASRESFAQHPNNNNMVVGPCTHDHENSIVDQNRDNNRDSLGHFYLPTIFTY